MGGNGGYAFAGRITGSDDEPGFEITSVLRNFGGDVTAVITALSEEGAPPSGTDGIVNGLYSLTTRMRDGIDVANIGPMPPDSA